MADRPAPADSRVVDLFAGPGGWDEGLRDAGHGRVFCVGLEWEKWACATAKAKEAWVDAESADLRLTRDLAEAEKLAALEALRSRRQQLSSIQTIVNAERVEAEFARVGPERGP